MWKVVSLLLCLLLCGVAHAKISDENIKFDSRSIILIEEPFGFLEEGFIDLTITRAAVGLANTQVADDPNPVKLGFFITTTQFEVQLEAQYSQGACLLDVVGVKVNMWKEEEEDALVFRESDLRHSYRTLPFYMHCIAIDAWTYIVLVTSSW